jgi:hypothetical protein
VYHSYVPFSTATSDGHPVFIVVRIEEPQLLATMNRIERVVGVERDPPWELPEGAHAGRPNPSVIFLHLDANKMRAK